jgi:hypothetical protein
MGERAHQWPSVAISGHQWPSGAISGHQWLSGTCSMGESGCGSVESASRSSGTSSFGSVYLWGKEEGAGARRGEHVHASASRGTSSFQIRGGTYMMQFENWRKKVLDGWSGMSTCRCNARSDEIRGDQTRSRAIEWRSAVIRGHQRSSRGHRRSSEVIRGHRRSSEVIRGHQRSSEVTQSALTFLPIASASAVAVQRTSEVDGLTKTR